jgi:heptosyltransferase-3
VEILILHPGGLGDIILSLPAISLLRSQSRGARITAAGNIDHLAPLMGGYAERVVSLSSIPLHRLYTPEPLPEEDIRFWRNYDRIISWTGAGSDAFIGKMRAVHPNAAIASWHPELSETRHVSQLFIDSLGLEARSLEGAVSADILLESSILREGEHWLAEHGWDCKDSLVALHPGAGAREKRWPLDRFIELAKWLVLRTGEKPLIIEGPAEIGLGKCVQQALHPGESILLASASLKLLAAVLGQCKSFIGNDSGVAHLAAGLRIPSIVLFGPTLPQHWAPLGRDVITMRDSTNCEACSIGRDKKHTCLSNISAHQAIDQLKIQLLCVAKTSSR